MTNRTVTLTQGEFETLTALLVKEVERLSADYVASLDEVRSPNPVTKARGERGLTTTFGKLQSVASLYHAVTPPQETPAP